MSKEKTPKGEAKILYGPEDATVVGDALEERREAAMTEVLARTRSAKPSPAHTRMIEDTVQGQAQSERDILVQLLQHHTAKVEKGDVEVLVDNGMLIKRIRASRGYVLLSAKEIGRLMESYKKMEQVPEAWALYGDLFEQLYRPTYAAAAKEA